MSDFTYLSRRQQTETRLASEAQCVEARRAHESLARAYARKIAGFQKAASAPAI